MLIKEYRIVMPLSIEEYRIGQLYTILKKSEEFTSSPGSAITIKENKPFNNGPEGRGQYTEKIYHIADHLPNWLKSFLPKDAMIAEEYAWNAYPNTRTKYVYPFVDRFFMEVETKYVADCGKSDNVFNLSKQDLKERQIEYIDFVNDSSDKRDPDPKTFVSKVTGEEIAVNLESMPSKGRGPLTGDWLDTYLKESPMPILCAYKLCRVEFKFWGIQSRVERFIDDVALRRTFLSAHRSVWCWQDEWAHLTLQDIRNMEKDVQKRLEERLRGLKGRDSDQESASGGENVAETSLRMWSNQLSFDAVEAETSDIDEWADARWNMDDFAESRFTSAITFSSAMDKASQCRKPRNHRRVSVKSVIAALVFSFSPNQTISILVVKSTWSSAHTMAHILTKHQDYRTFLNSVIAKANSIHSEFDAGCNVHVVADGIGAVIAYDALVQSSVADSACKFVFDVNNLICLGSPIGTVLMRRKLAQKVSPPGDTNIYNLFFTNDPSAARIEPILDPRFHSVPPAPIGRSSRTKRSSALAVDEQVPTDILWSSGERIDYYVYAPSIVSQLPVKFLDIVLSSSYWENEDISNFILDKISTSNRLYSDDSVPFVNHSQSDGHIPAPVSRFGSQYVLKNLTPNHSATDMLLSEKSEQILRAKFSYGPLKVVPLAMAKVDVYAHMLQSNLLQLNMNSANQRSNWMSLGTGTTGPYGRLDFKIKERLLPGSYDIKMIVRTDKSVLQFGAFVVAENSKAVVFGVDGALMASFTVRGKNAKVQGAAVDCVRHWQRLGFPIIYLSGRPKTQQPSLTLWLSVHNFPRGPLLLSDGIYPRDSRHKKLNLLNQLCVFAHISTIQAAYGSHKDVSIFKDCGLRIEKIYIVQKRGIASNTVHAKFATNDRDGCSSWTSRGSNPKIPEADAQIETLHKGYIDHLLQLSKQLKIIHSV